MQDDRTLRDWCSKLIARGIVAKEGYSTRWRTCHRDGRKIQEPVEEADEEEMREYFKRRGELFKDHYIAELEQGFPPRVARKAAWKETYMDLWGEYECCYYYCKGFILTAFSYNDVDLREIFELCREIASAPPPTERRTVFPPQSCNKVIIESEFVF